MRYAFLLISFVYADVSNIIEMINDIQKRYKKAPEVLKYNIFENPKPVSLKAPVIALKPLKKEEEFNVDIAAIFNDRVFINGKWYKTGEKIGGYKIVKINTESVVFTNGAKTYTISIKKNLIRITK
ncbi:MAG: hypothetical protein GXO62_04785 [Epsilonproteobacteria bacterium]|nr:hypothetical protein [Campylobacterota bacterium]